MAGSIDRYGTIVESPGPWPDSEGVVLSNKPLLGLLIAGGGPSTIEISIDNGVTWVALMEADGTTPAVNVASDVFISSNDLAPLAAYCINPVRVRVANPATSVTAVTWICAG